MVIDSPSQYYDQNVRRNYFQDHRENVDGLKYRLDAKDVIKEIELALSAVEVDQYGKIIKENPDDRIVNDHGIIAARLWLKAALGKITHLTNFEHLEHVNRQQRWLAKDWCFQVTLHSKKWGVTDKDALQMLIEKQLYESMLRAQKGFENNNISRSYSVQEHIEPPPEKQPGQPGIFSFWRR